HAQNGLEPRDIDGVIECWLKPKDAGASRAHDDPAHCDFWRAAPSGQAFIMRGYLEDSQETFAPRTVFDTTLPVWRMAEELLHARNLAHEIADDPSKITVRFRALYTGLSGRVLRAWANPLADLMVEGGAARSDEAALETTATVPQIERRLAETIHPMIA